MNPAMIADHEAAIALNGRWTELVRGQEQALLNWLLPVVRRQSIVLDLRAVERIDAAGIAALISLYTGAHENGHEFRVERPSAQVAEILRLVGLDTVLLAPEEARELVKPSWLRCPAA